MNTQQLFNTAAKGIYEQGRVSIDDNGTCLYRGPDGAKCAAGILITDANYNEDLEAQSVSDPIVREALTRSVGRLSGKAFSVAEALQAHHDEIGFRAPPVGREFRRLWLEAIADVAGKHNLKTWTPEENLS